MIKVCHLTSVHPRYDSRIFWKECRSLSSHGFKVYLVVADNRGDEINEGIEIYDAGKRGGRLYRIFYTTWKVFRRGKKLDAEIYHFHDPELLFIGIVLKILGKKVIYDIHEDYILQFKNKNYLKSSFLKNILSLLYSGLCRIILRFFDYLIVPTPTIRQRYEKYNKRITDIKNYPDLAQFKEIKNNSFGNNELCYIGGISESRGLLDIINALETLPVKLHIAGPCNDILFFEKMKILPGWKRVQFHGYVDRNGIKKILERSQLGYVVLHPLPNYIDALPIKLFEYMAAGVPVVSSDFPVYKKIVDDANCGICIKPGFFEDIRAVTAELITKPKYLKQLGLNGRETVFKKYFWEKEGEKLSQIYLNFFKQEI